MNRLLTALSKGFILMIKPYKKKWRFIKRAVPGGVLDSEGRILSNLGKAVRHYQIEKDKHDRKSQEEAK